MKPAEAMKMPLQLKKWETILIWWTDKRDIELLHLSAMLTKT